MEYLTFWWRLFQTVAAWNEKDLYLFVFVFNEGILHSLVSEAEQSSVQCWTSLISLSTFSFQVFFLHAYYKHTQNKAMNNNILIPLHLSAWLCLYNIQTWLATDQRSTCWENTSLINLSDAAMNLKKSSSVRRYISVWFSDIIIIQNLEDNCYHHAKFDTDSIEWKDLCYHQMAWQPNIITNIHIVSSKSK